MSHTRQKQDAEFRVAVSYFEIRAFDIKRIGMQEVSWRVKKLIRRIMFLCAFTALGITHWHGTSGIVA